MANLNKVMLIGRLTRDPEIRMTPSGTPVADMGLAVNRFYKSQSGDRQEETAFVDLTAWGRQAELAQQYLGKGRQLFVEGYLKFEQWQSQDGQKRNKLSVTVLDMQFLDRPGEGGDNSGGGGGDNRQYNSGGGQQYGGGGGYGGGQQYGGGGGNRQYGGGGQPYGGGGQKGGNYQPTPDDGGGPSDDFGDPGFGEGPPSDDDIPF